MQYWATKCGKHPNRKVAKYIQMKYKWWILHHYSIYIFGHIYIISSNNVKSTKTLIFSASVPSCCSACWRSWCPPCRRRSSPSSRVSAWRSATSSSWWSTSSLASSAPSSMASVTSSSAGTGPATWPAGALVQALDASGRCGWHRRSASRRHWRSRPCAGSGKRRCSCRTHCRGFGFVWPLTSEHKTLFQHWPHAVQSLLLSFFFLYCKIYVSIIKIAFC